MSDTAPVVDPNEPEPEDEPDPQALAAELDLGLDLSEEERAEADKMVAHLRSEMGLDEPAPEPEPEPAESTEPDPGEPEPEPEPLAPPVTSSPDFVVIDGRAVPVTEARSLIDLRNYLNANPDKAAEVRRVIEGQAVAPAEPPAPPEWVDQDDPASLAQWQHLSRIEEQQAAILKNQQLVARQAAQAQAHADIAAGLQTFRTLHPELSESDVDTLRVHAVSLNIIPGLEQKMNGTDAVTKALDIAYWDHPEFRARATAQPSPAAVKKEKADVRKAKLNALAGTSGSAPRQESATKPSTDREMKSAAAKWLSEQGIL